MTSPKHDWVDLILTPTDLDLLGGKVPTNQALEEGTALRSDKVLTERPLEDHGGMLLTVLRKSLNLYPDQAAKDCGMTEAEYRACEEYRYTPPQNGQPRPDDPFSLERLGGIVQGLGLDRNQANGLVQAWARHPGRGAQFLQALRLVPGYENGLPEPVQRKLPDFVWGIPKPQKPDWRVLPKEQREEHYRKHGMHGDAPPARPAKPEPSTEHAAAPVAPARGAVPAAAEIPSDLDREKIMRWHQEMAEKLKHIHRGHDADDIAERIGVAPEIYRRWEATGDIPTGGLLNIIVHGRPPAQEARHMVELFELMHPNDTAGKTMLDEAVANLTAHSFEPPLHEADRAKPEPKPPTPPKAEKPAKEAKPPKPLSEKALRRQKQKEIGGMFGDFCGSLSNDEVAQRCEVTPREVKGWRKGYIHPARVQNIIQGLQVPADQGEVFGDRCHALYPDAESPDMPKLPKPPKPPSEQDRRRQVLQEVAGMANAFKKARAVDEDKMAVDCQMTCGAVMQLLKNGFLYPVHVERVIAGLHVAPDAAQAFRDKCRGLYTHKPTLLAQFEATQQARMAAAGPTDTPPSNGNMPPPNGKINILDTALPEGAAVIRVREKPAHKPDNTSELQAAKEALGRIMEGFARGAALLQPEKITAACGVTRDKRQVFIKWRRGEIAPEHRSGIIRGFSLSSDNQEKFLAACARVDTLEGRLVIAAESTVQGARHVQKGVSRRVERGMDELQKLLDSEARDR